MAYDPDPDQLAHFAATANRDMRNVYTLELRSQQSPGPTGFFPLEAARTRSIR
jgi:hypothetical protein